jgi:prepilin-type processing-associated H-X9-DG protein
LPTDRHNQAGNFSFVDGHCERWKWRYPKIFSSAGQATANAADLADLQKVQAGMPGPP